MLEAAIYFLLKKHFRNEKYYVDLLELFHEVQHPIAPFPEQGPGNRPFVLLTLADDVSN
jgi:hypothetical protein